MCRARLNWVETLVSEEFHISSLVVYGKVGMLKAISTAIVGLPGAEVHASDAAGKLIVTLETASESEISKRIDAIRALDGVFAASLVYHQVEDANTKEAGSLP